MKKFIIIVFTLLLVACSSHRTSLHYENDGIYHNSNNEEAVVDNVSMTRFSYVNVYHHNFLYTPLYLNTWYNPYWGWNNYWNWYPRVHYNYWGWNSWVHYNYWGWNHPYQYNPHGWNRRTPSLSSRAIEPIRLTPRNNSIGFNRYQGIRPSTAPNRTTRPSTSPSRSNQNVRPSTAPNRTTRPPTSPSRSNQNVRPSTAPSRSNQNVRPSTAPSRSNQNVRPSTVPNRTPSRSNQNNRPLRNN